MTTRIKTSIWNKSGPKKRISLLNGAIKARDKKWGNVKIWK